MCAYVITNIKQEMALGKMMKGGAHGVGAMHKSVGGIGKFQKGEEEPEKKGKAMPEAVQAAFSKK
jgi:hypothetical protein